MALNLGVHVEEKATAVSTPAVATSGIPYVVGLAPAHTAESPAKANTPVLCTSWDEAEKQLGYSEDWETYTLCEFMFAHFKLYGCQPVIFCNVLDASTMNKAVEAADYEVGDHRITLPYAAIAASIKVTSGDTELEADADYSVLYDTDACIIELLSSGNAYDAETLNVSYSKAEPDSVTSMDIIAGLSAVDACMSTAGVIPDIICAPGWSGDTVVAAVMATKSESINGLFRAKALIDIPTGEGGVKEYSELVSYKNDNNLIDENQILCWPMATLGGNRFHMSTHLAGLMAQVDTGNGGIPYESPSNKRLQIDGCCLEDGTEVNLTFDQSNVMAECGIVTALNFMSMGWTARNNYTACYPGNADVKDQFIPVSRMFDFVANTLIKTFWSKLDKPMTLRLLDSIQDSCNIWLNGLVSQEYLLGARVELIAAENPLTNLLAGVISFHIYLTPPVPAQEIHFSLEFDVDYLTSALTLA